MFDSVKEQLSRCRTDVAAFTRTLVRAKEACQGLPSLFAIEARLRLQAVKMAAQTQNMSS